MRYAPRASRSRTPRSGHETSRGVDPTPPPALAAFPRHISRVISRISNALGVACLLAVVVPVPCVSAQRIDSVPPWTHVERSIAIDERLASDAGLRIGDRVVLAAEPGSKAGDT